MWKQTGSAARGAAAFGTLLMLGMLLVQTPGCSEYKEVAPPESAPQDQDTPATPADSAAK